MLTTVGDRCGIAAYSRELIAGLRTLPDTEVEIVEIEPGRQPIERYREQAEALNDAGIDVIHIQHEHSFWGGILPRTSGYWELRYLLNKPIVLTAHTTYSAAEMLRIATERRPHKWAVKKLLLRNRSWVESVEIAPFVTAITVVHTAAARSALLERGAKPEFVHIVPTGVPAPLPETGTRAELLKQFNIQGRRLITLFGYVSPNKGYELVEEALQALPPEVTFVIGGEARNEEMRVYAAALQQRLERSESRERIIQTGFLSDEDVGALMRASEIVLAPHTQATGSYSVALPIAYGRPTLASDLDCFREMRARVDCLELFPAGDAAGLAEKLIALLANPDRQSALSRGALEYARRYAWPKVAASTRRVYEQAIEVYGTGLGHRPGGSV